MQFQSAPFIPLDIIHLLNLLPLVLIAVTLFTLSVVHKLHDCDGFYARCIQIDPKNITFDQKTRRSLDQDVTALVHLLTHKLAELSYTRPSLADGEQDQLEKSSRDNEKDTFVPQLKAFHNGLNKIWNYDWIGIDQYVILISLLFIVIFGFLATLLRKRSLTFISILLCLSHFIQLALIEVSDDREFPASIFRDGKTIARYSLVYFDQSSLSLLLKSSLLVLLLIEFILLLVNFVLIRYEKLLCRISVIE